MKRACFSIIVIFLVLFEAHPLHAAPPKAVQARAFIVMDERDAILCAKNPQTKLPPASTVKLMTAMVALDLLDPAAQATVSKKAGRVRSIRPRLKSHDELTVSDLLHLMLMKSVNSAAVALAEAAAGSEDAFVALMNRKAEELGALDTLFGNASGLPGGTQYTTARDLTVILKYALTYPLIREIIGKKEWIISTAAGRKLYLGNTDYLLWCRKNMLGGKTGFTGSAQHCFVGALETDQGLIFTAVLGAPSRSRLWKNILLLADFGAKMQPDHTPTTHIDIPPQTPGRAHESAPVGEDDSPVLRVSQDTPDPAEHPALLAISPIVRRRVRRAPGPQRRDEAGT